LLMEGVDPEKVAECLRWQEFEHFAESALGQHSFKTKRHFIFKHGSGKHEIDLLAWRHNLLLCVDCKQWDYGWSPSRIRSAVNAQRLRVRALAREPGQLGRVASSWEGFHLLPVMVGLRTTNTKIVEGTPVVPVLRLGSFLFGVNPAVEGLCFERPRIRSRLSSWVG
jgi:hypothetical protein